jgi:hypothetical protein
MSLRQTPHRRIDAQSAASGVFDMSGPEHNANTRRGAIKPAREDGAFEVATVRHRRRKAEGDR